MKKLTKSFTGTSERGNLEEAIGHAIQQAKESLRTDFVTWAMKKISGHNGGFAQTNKVSVMIAASSGQAKT
jgi:flavin-binding protein dodecin